MKCTREAYPKQGEIYYMHKLFLDVIPAKAGIQVPETLYLKKTEAIGS